MKTQAVGRRHGLITIAALAAVIGTGCGPEVKTGPNLDRLPGYEGPLAQSFNDSIEPSVFGLTLEQRSLQGDPGFRTRATSADVVATLRITTVTSSRADDKVTYTLQFEPVKVHLGELDDAMLDLRLTEQQSQAYSVISAVTTRAQKKVVVAMFKRFREKNRATTHFYMAPDNTDTTKALQDALALDALRSKL